MPFSYTSKKRKNISPYSRSSRMKMSYGAGGSGRRVGLGRSRYLRNLPSQVSGHAMKFGREFYVVSHDGTLGIQVPVSPVDNSTKFMKGQVQINNNMTKGFPDFLDSAKLFEDYCITGMTVVCTPLCTAIVDGASPLYTLVEHDHLKHSEITTVIAAANRQSKLVGTHKGLCDNNRTVSYRPRDSSEVEWVKCSLASSGSKDDCTKAWLKLIGENQAADKTLFHCRVYMTVKFRGRAPN